MPDNPLFHLLESGIPGYADDASLHVKRGPEALEAPADPLRLRCWRHT